MNFRVSMMVIGLLVLNAIVVEAQFIANDTGNIMEETEQSAEPREQSLTTPAEILVPASVIDQAVKSNVDRLHLNMYEAAAAGDLSLCGDDTICLKHAKDIKSWICGAAVCDGTDTSKKPVDCFEGASDPESKEDRDQRNSSLCSLIKTPSSETRRNLLTHMGYLEYEDNFVESEAYLMALKGSAVSCESYIKDYVGPYGGPQWNYRWYRALSGCRILAHESTREQEEKDFYTWFGVLREVGDPCLDIVNSELRNACSTPGAHFLSPDAQ